MAQLQKVATVAELPEGGKMLVEVEGRPIALFNVGGQYYAIDDVCTHDGGPLAEGDLYGYEVECPRHGARFDIRSGAALCMPAFEGVGSYAVKVDGEAILVEVPKG